MSKLAKSLVLLFVLLTAAAVFADVTVGTYNTGNCYPFLCNDSGTSTGTAIDYQQAYSHGAFSGAITITNLEFYYASQFGGSSTMLDGTYNIYLGYSANPFNALSSNQVANRGSNFTLVDSFTVNGNGCDFNPVCSIILATPFTYNPNSGDLLLEIVASNQPTVFNGSGNGYAEADNTGSVMWRNWCLGASDCANGIVDSVGLVTTFSTGTTTVPEPGSMAMLGTGLVAIAGILRKRLNRR
jgi:PEP-CTERM motif